VSQQLAESRSRRGFTLIELLIALVLSGIVAGVVFQLVLGQGRFAQLQGAREEVQQNARAALEVISSELRGIGHEGIADGTADAITLRSPLAWGLVCGYLGTSDEYVAVLFPSPAQQTVIGEANRLPDQTVFLAAPATVVGGPAWEFLEVTDVTAGGLSGAGLSDANSKCNTGLDPEPDVAGTNANASRVRVYASKATLPPIPSSMLAGSSVYLYRTVTYDVGASDFPDQWIRRNAEAMSGPVPNDGGLVFTYFAPAGGVDQDITADIEAAADLAARQALLNDVRRVRIQVNTQSTATFGGQAQGQSDSTEVYLRNRN
jgi:prepilin-type N-terminal cleavage/methylation domain-containing protein